MTQSKPKKPGRKPISAKQSVEMRSAILAAAEQLFIEKGYQGVSMRALAGELEMSPMSLYRYFDNKRSILIHLWANIFSTLFEKCRKTAGTQSNPREAIAAYGASFIQYWIDNRQNYLMVYGEIDRPETSESFFADSELVQNELEYLAGLFVQAGVAEESYELACQQYLCALHGICHSIITIPEMNWASPAELLSGLLRGILAQQTV
ncbi:MAG: TetR/AcrR family transcriptional regulator [Rhizobiaceae bacterium]